jgi:hypothetical protein
MRLIAGYCLIFLVAIAIIGGLLVGLVSTSAGGVDTVDDQTGRTLERNYVWRNGYGLTVSYPVGKLPRLKIESGLDVEWLDDDFIDN